jgi:hypothetical protein
MPGTKVLNAREGAAGEGLDGAETLGEAEGTLAATTAGSDAALTFPLRVTTWTSRLAVLRMASPRAAAVVGSSAKQAQAGAVAVGGTKTTVMAVLTGDLLLGGCGASTVPEEQ